RVVFTVIALLPALPEQAQYFAGFCEHLLTHVGGGAALAGGVFGGGFTRAHAKPETAPHHRRRGRRRLRNDRRMNAHRRAGHTRAKAQPFSRLRDCADHTPHERALALPVRPRVIVIRNHGEGKTDFFGTPRILNEFSRAVFLAAKFVADFHFQSSFEPRLVAGVS